MRVTITLHLIVGDYRTTARIFASDRMNEARQRRTMMRQFADYATRYVGDRRTSMLGERSEKKDTLIQTLAVAKLLRKKKNTRMY